jgi:hypothetical protein
MENQDRHLLVRQAKPYYSDGLAAAAFGKKALNGVQLGRDMTFPNLQLHYGMYSMNLLLIFCNLFVIKQIKE